VANGPVQANTSQFHWYHPYKKRGSAWMIFVDPRTIVVKIFIISGLLALVFFSLKRKFPTSIQGLREWSLSCCW
jgi:hypothetical protein